MSAEGECDCGGPHVFACRNAVNKRVERLECALIELFCLFIKQAPRALKTKEAAVSNNLHALVKEVCQPDLLEHDILRAKKGKGVGPHHE